MHDIVGTVIDVKSFYGNAKAEVQFTSGLESKQLFSLKENRIYRIPYFQREIRWSKENLIELINDIERKPKFLGNVIFTKDNEGNYDILDGQQRSTVILLLMQYIKHIYGDRIQVIDTCAFEVCSFSGFKNLYDYNFKLSAIPEIELEAIKKTDDYKQMQRYIELWTEISRQNVFRTVSDADGFLKNLMNCEVNVIISTGNEDDSIEYFLDVNLKGVLLDREDIFKGYLCAQDNSDEIHKVWSDIKKLDSVIMEDKKIDYPFMSVLEHYYKCVLCKEDNYKDIDFNEEFKLKSERVIEGKRYSEDEHIVKVIHDKGYFRKSLSEFKQLMEMISSIVNESNATSAFKKIFEDYNSKQIIKKDKIDSDEIDVIYNLLRKIILDSNKVPKCLVVKYIVDILIGKSENKKEYQYIYGVFAASVMFMLFETKKGSEKIYKIVKNENWNLEISKFVYNYFRVDELANRQITASYKYVESGRINDKTEKQLFRCKSIATIYNFLHITEEQVSVRNHKMKNLNVFLNDSEKFSVEHFVINESGTCNIALNNGKKFIYEYPSDLVKYRDSLFNYIFISRDNNSFLGNRIVSDKIKLIETNQEDKFKDENCDYSKKVVDILRNKLKVPNVSAFNDVEEAKTELDRYYQMDFRNKFAFYATEMIKAVTSER